MIGLTLQSVTFGLYVRFIHKVVQSLQSYALAPSGRVAMISIFTTHTHSVSRRLRNSLYHHASGAEIRSSIGGTGRKQPKAKGAYAVLQTMIAQSITLEDLNQAPLGIVLPLLEMLQVLYAI